MRHSKAWALGSRVLSRSQGSRLRLSITWNASAARLNRLPGADRAGQGKLRDHRAGSPASKQVRASNRVRGNRVRGNRVRGNRARGNRVRGNSQAKAVSRVRRRVPAVSRLPAAAARAVGNPAWLAGTIHGAGTRLRAMARAAMWAIGITEAELSALPTTTSTQGTITLIHRAVRPRLTTPPLPADPESTYRQGLAELNQLHHLAQKDPAALKEIQDLTRKMQQLDPQRFPGNPALVEELHTQVLTGIDRLELQLRHDAGDAEAGQVRTTKEPAIAPGYEDAVANTSVAWAKVSRACQ